MKTTGNHRVFPSRAWLFFAWLLWLCVPATLLYAADGEVAHHIGRVFQLEGQAFGKTQGADPTPLTVNKKLFAQEEISTQKAAAVTIKFRDGSTFSLGPDAKISLNKYIFNPLASKIENNVQIKKGTFRYTSGFAVKTARVAFKTPRVSIGVRGTVVEGVSEEAVPTLINIPKGQGMASNATGEENIEEGAAIAALGADQRLPKPDTIPVAVTAQAIQFFQKEIGKVSLEGTPLTKEQQLSDAHASQLSIAEQMILAKKSDRFFGQWIEKTVQWLATLLKKLVALWDHVSGWFSASLDHVVAEISFVRSAWAATIQELKDALSLLSKAASVGLLTTSDQPPTPTQQAQQQAFIQQANRQIPNADKIVRQHQKSQQKRNWTNTKNSTQEVISGAALVTKNNLEIAGIVQAAIQSSPGSTAELAKIIVRSALSAQGKTDTAESAVFIVAAACRADKNLASTIAASGIIGLPTEIQQQAATLIASAAAKAAPDKAVEIAVAITRVAGYKVAGAVAASVTLAVKSQAVAIAVAMTRLVGAEKSAEIAAAVTRVAHPHDAARIAAAVVEVAGPEAAAGIAAAVAQVAAARAQSIASAATDSAGGSTAINIAAQIAAAVAIASGQDVDSSILKAVSESTGISEDELKKAMGRAIQSGELDAILKIGAEAAAKAVQYEQQAMEALQMANKAANAATEIEKLMEEAAKPPEDRDTTSDDDDDQQPSLGGGTSQAGPGPQDDDTLGQVPKTEKEKKDAEEELKNPPIPMEQSRSPS